MPGACLDFRSELFRKLEAFRRAKLQAADLDVFLAAAAMIDPLWVQACNGNMLKNTLCIGFSRAVPDQIPGVEMARGVINKPKSQVCLTAHHTHLSAFCASFPVRRLKDVGQLSSISPQTLSDAYDSLSNTTRAKEDR